MKITRLISALALAVCIFALAACDKKAPTDPDEATGWPVAFHVTVASDQSHTLQGVKITILSGNADITNVVTDGNGNTPAVTVYQEAAPASITISADPSDIQEQGNYVKFTGSVIVSPSWSPREQKLVYVGNVGLEKVF